MSIGKPVIVSNARPTERIVTEEHPAVRDACGRRGRVAVVRRYNWETDERRLLGAIRAVTGPVGSRNGERLKAIPAPTGQERQR